MSGVGLSEAGHAQARTLAASLAGTTLRAVWASPLQRAQETAAPIAARQGLPVHTDEALNEIDFGDWTALGFDTLHDRPDWIAWNRLRSCNRAPGGETMGEAQARALAAIWRLCDSVPDGDVAVVSHSDVLKSILAHMLGVPLDLMGRIEVDPASRSVVTLFGTDLRIRAVNLPAATAA